MSLQAMIWALHLTPEQLGEVSPAAHLTLIAVADCAGPDGEAAWPSAQRLADVRSCSVRTIRRHLEQLEEAGLIRRGNQKIVSHLRKDRRPIVWDLPIKPVDNSPERGDTLDIPLPPRGDTHGTHGVTPVVTQTVLEPYVDSKYSSTDRGDTFSTALEVDIPDRDCIHGQAMLWYDDRKTKRRLPMCPYCRKVVLRGGVPTLEPLEATHA